MLVSDRLKKQLNTNLNEETRGPRQQLLGFKLN